MGLAEQVIGIKAKKFLMESIYLFATKYSKIVNNWVDQVSEIIETTVAQSFDPDEKRIEEHTSKFLQWLGFSPVDVKWQPDQKTARFLIGTSRMWKDPKTDDVTKVLMYAVVRSLGKKLIGERPDVVQITGQLPPRIIAGYEVRERYGDNSPIELTSTLISQEGSTITLAKNEISTTPSSSAGTSGQSYLRYKPIIENFIGTEINEEEVATTLSDKALDLLQQYYKKDLESYDVSTLNLLLFLFQRSAKEDKWKERAQELGKNFATALKDNYPNLTPNNAIQGMGALKPDTFDEFLFYGKHQATEEYCYFIAIIWQEYISSFMGAKFKADKPLCATTGSSLCLYSFIRSV